MGHRLDYVAPLNTKYSVAISLQSLVYCPGVLSLLTDASSRLENSIIDTI